jgi:glycerol-3-phosphate acyltransferase PlsY
VGYVVAQALGVDIRRRGSGNIGATNVLRTLGRGPAVLTLAGDVGKGYVGAWLGSLAGPEPVWAAAGAVVVVAGNCWSVFLGFRGGKGMATGLGAFLRVTPWAVLPAALVWLALVASSRYVSLASMCAVAALPVSILAFRYPPPLAGAGAVVALVIIARHRDNIARLLTGSEHRFKG